MVKILLSLYFAIAPLMSFAATGLPVPGKIEDATIFPGLMGPSNYVANPIAWPNKLGVHPPLYATQDRSTSTDEKIMGKSSWTCDASAQTGYCAHKLLSLGDEMAGGYCQVIGYFKGDASLYSVQVMESGTVKYTEPLKRDFGSKFGDFKSAQFPCSKDYDAIRVTQTESGTAPKINYGLFFGKATGLAQYATASFFGGMEQAGVNGGTCLYAENTSTGLGDFKDLGTGSGCNAWVVDDGSVGISAVGTNDHRINIASMSVGMYKFSIIGTFQVTAQLCSWQLNDGSKTYQSQGAQWQPNTGSGDGAIPSLHFYVPISSAKTTSTTFKLQAADSGSNACTLNNAFSGANIAWKIEYSPTSSQLAVNPNLPTQPTIQKFTSGSGTYTTPAGVTSIKVRIVAGGGAGGGAAATAGGQISAGAGGGGGGYVESLINNPASQYSYAVGSGGTGVSGSAGNNGGNTTFGSLTAGGGPGGAFGAVSSTNTLGGGGGPGGTATGGDLNIVGGPGQAAIYQGQNGISASGAGGPSFFGTGGRQSYNTGAGVAGNAYGSGGGGASNPASTAATAGGAGGSGYIEVTEYYQGMNAPVLLRGLVYSTTVQSGKSAGPNSFDFGTYTPTLTNGTNVSSSTLNGAVFTYSRMGNIVHVSGPIGVTCSSTSNVITALGISLPIASSLASSTLAGVSGAGDVTMVGSLFPDVANTRANWHFVCSGQQAHRVQFDYLVE